MTYCCHQTTENASCCDTTIAENLVVKLPVASMVPVTTSFGGSNYTTALPTLLSSTTTASPTNGSSASSMPHSSKRLSVGAGVGIGIAAVLGVLLLALALGMNKGAGIVEAGAGKEPQRKTPAEIDGSGRHELQ